MKKTGLLVLLTAVTMLFVGDAFGGGRGSYCARPKVWIEISPPEQETFVQGEETHFDIHVRSNRPDWWLKCYLKDAQMEGSFPDTETAVELEKVSNVEYAFDTGSLSKVGTNTLSVTLYKVNVHLIKSLERIKTCLEAKVDYYRGLLEGDISPCLRRLLEKLVVVYEQIIERIEDRIAAAKKPIASAEVSFGVIADTTPPTVEWWDPVCEAEGVSVYEEIRVKFSEPINPDTVTTNTFRVCAMEIVPPVVESKIQAYKATIRDIAPEDLCTTIEGSFSFEDDNTVAVFTPTNSLPLSTVIYRGVGKYVLGETIEDRYGNGLEGIDDCYFVTEDFSIQKLNPNGILLDAVPVFYPSEPGELKPITRITGTVPVWPYIEIGEAPVIDLDTLEPITREKPSPYQVDKITLSGEFWGQKVASLVLSETTAYSLEFVSEDGVYSVRLPSKVYCLSNKRVESLCVGVKALVDTAPTDWTWLRVSEIGAESMCFNRVKEDIRVELLDGLEPGVKNRINFSGSDNRHTAGISAELFETSRNSNLFKLPQTDAIVKITDCPHYDDQGRLVMNVKVWSKYLELRGRVYELVADAPVVPVFGGVVFTFRNIETIGYELVPPADVPDICPFFVRITDPSVPLEEGEISAALLTDYQQISITLMRVGPQSYVFESGKFLLVSYTMAVPEPIGYSYLYGFLTSDELVRVVYQEKEEKEEIAKGAFYGLHYGDPKGTYLDERERKWKKGKFRVKEKLTHIGYLNKVGEDLLGYAGKTSQPMTTQEITNKAQDKKIWYSLTHGKDWEGEGATKRLVFQGIEIKDDDMLTPGELVNLRQRFNFELAFINACGSAMEKDTVGNIKTATEDFKKTLFEARNGAYLGWTTALGDKGYERAAKFAEVFFISLDGKSTVNSARKTAFKSLWDGLNKPAWVKDYAKVFKILGNKQLVIDNK